MYEEVLSKASGYGMWVACVRNVMHVFWHGSRENLCGVVIQELVGGCGLAPIICETCAKSLAAMEFPMLSTTFWQSLHAIHDGALAISEDLNGEWNAWASPPQYSTTGGIWMPMENSARLGCGHVCAPIMTIGWAVDVRPDASLTVFPSRRIGR